MKLVTTRALLQALSAATCATLASSALAQVSVLQKISNSSGGLLTMLNAGDRFGQEVARLGDLDDDGVEDLVVGAYRDDSAGADAGAVYVLFMNANGTVKAEQKITTSFAGFVGAVTGEQISPFDNFGTSVSAIGDLDFDGNTEIVVGAPGDSSNNGAVWIIFLNDNGTVKPGKTRYINQVLGGLPTPGGQFGFAVAGIGDINGDLAGDIAVGAPFDIAAGGTSVGTGTVYVIRLNLNGTLQFSVAISEGLGGFGGDIGVDQFGASVTDFGLSHIVVGAPGNDDGGPNRGAIWVIGINSSGSATEESKISQTSGGFGGQLSDGDSFGISVSEVRTGVGDGAPDLLVGAYLDDDGGTSNGAVWLLFMDFQEDLDGEIKISETTGGFTGSIDPGDQFGFGVGAVDLDNDFVDELLVGMPEEFDVVDESGAVFVLAIDCIGEAQEVIRNSATAPNPFNFNPGASGPPIIGQTWDPFVTPFLPIGVPTDGFDFVFVDAGPPIDVPGFLTWGTLLCNVPTNPALTFLNAAHGDPLLVPIPDDCSLVGATFCTQGGSFNRLTGQITLLNAIDVTIGTIDL